MQSDRPEWGLGGGFVTANKVTVNMVRVFVVSLDMLVEFEDNSSEFCFIKSYPQKIIQLCLVTADDLLQFSTFFGVSIKKKLVNYMDTDGILT